ncbi:MAG: BrnT family toxin, partial [Chloroflexia bacterium]|nr:BrnT family toxin [Chloroflexia bacterium]
MRFEWDIEKERINRAKHGFGFEIGEEVFADPLLTSKPDAFYNGEERWK